MDTRTVRMMSIVGGIIILVSSLLPWYSVRVEIISNKGGAVLSMYLSLWGVSIDDQLGIFFSGTKNYLEMIDYVPRDLGPVFYVPLILLMLLIMGGGFILLGVFRSQGNSTSKLWLLGLILSSFSLAVFLVGVLGVKSIVSEMLGIQITNPLFGAFSFSDQGVTLSFSWGLMYGFFGVLAGFILSTTTFFLVQRGPPLPLPGQISELPIPPPPTRSNSLPGRTIYCIHCGAELPSNALFCDKCGKRQEYSP